MMATVTDPFPPRRRRKRFVRSPPELPDWRLTGRDVELVRLVKRHRFLGSDHLAALSAGPDKKIAARLRVLFHAGYLDRPRGQLEHYRAGGGSNRMVYALSSRGARLLIEHDGPGDDPHIDWARKNQAAGRPFILHALAIADVTVALTRAVRARAGFQLLGPDALLDSAPADTRRRDRPWTWTTRIQANDVSLSLGATPDLAFAIRYPDASRRCYLLEADRGTMPVDRADLAQTSIRRKCLVYAAGKRAGLHGSQFGWKAFRVLFVTATRARADTILAMIRATIPADARTLFYVADTPTLSAADIFDYNWRDADGNSHRLV
jgi:hypothetical protein